ncbi:MAG: flippase-like domain-containing protein [Lachnospiraceae bacterium]|nr:flippase-like domain-containing protein [Lachnospiraceae bacterium]
MSFSFSISLNTVYLFPVLFLFFGAHVLKFIRFALVLLEERKLSFFDVLFLYVRTTLVNLIIPFKIGELYRVADVKHMTGSFKTGILLVVIDRFFDTLALLTLTLPFEILFLREADPVLGILFAALILLFICYLSYVPSFRYMNKYLITKKRSKRAMVLLDILDKANEWYLFLRKLIRGRSPLVFLSSLFGWIMEFAALKLFAASLGSAFDIDAFIRYINSLLSGGKNPVGTAYNTMGIIIFVILTVVLFISSTGRRKSPDTVKERNGALL